jgi:membrane protease YdiL (CAAX protease family)
MNFWYVTPGPRENLANKIGATWGILVGWMLIGAIVALALDDLIFTDKSNPIQNYSSAFSYFLFLIAGLWLAMKWFGRPFKTLITHRSRFDFRQYFFGFFLWLVLLLGSTVINYFRSPDDFTFTFEPSQFWLGVVALIIWLPIQTGAEELFFRGFLPQILSPIVRNPFVLLVLSSFLFAAPHLANPEAADNLGLAFLVYSIIGFTMGVGILVTGSLEIALGVHLANNFFGLALVGYANSAVPGTAIWTTPAADLEASLVSGILFVGLWYQLVRWLWPRIRQTA